MFVATVVYDTVGGYDRIKLFLLGGYHRIKLFLLGGYDHLLALRLLGRIAVLTAVVLGTLSRRELGLAQVAEITG